MIKLQDSDIAAEDGKLILGPVIVKYSDVEFLVGEIMDKGITIEPIDHNGWERSRCIMFMEGLVLVMKIKTNGIEDRFSLKLKFDLSECFSKFANLAIKNDLPDLPDLPESRNSWDSSDW